MINSFRYNNNNNNIIIIISIIIINNNNNNNIIIIIIKGLSPILLRIILIAISYFCRIVIFSNIWRTTLRKGSHVICQWRMSRSACALSGSSPSAGIFYRSHRFCKRTKKSLIKLRECAGWSWPMWSAYTITSRKYDIYIILTPLNPTLYSKTRVYRGIHYFSYFCSKT